MRVDAIVLGAGMVGVSVACHLQARGRRTLLLDRRGAGEETSFGNAGLIQREAIYPYGFPRDFATVLRHALNRSIDLHYHPAALLRLTPFLFRYWRNSSPARHAEIAKRYATLIEHCVAEHDALAAVADAGHLIRPTGWIKMFRSARERDARLAEAAAWRRDHGIGFESLDAAGLAAAEPHLAPVHLGGLRWTDPKSTPDPHGLVNAYLRHFTALGGLTALGDARTLSASSDGGWTARGWDGESFMARDVVVALGPWSDLVVAPLGYRLPLAVKRGYHMNYRPRGNATLNHVLLDVERGYVLAPIGGGVRLTTGAEFADRDAPRTPVQLARAEPVARDLFPLGERLEAEPWMGCRPVTPDMMPIIGRAPRHGGLWFAFGHAHHGLTLGPVTGRLVAEMVTGERPFVDPAPFRPERFG